MSKLKLKSLIIAISIYFILLIMIVISLYNPSISMKAKKYVEKNSNIIEVSLGNPLSKNKLNINNKSSKTKKNIKKVKVKKKIEKLKKRIVKKQIVKKIRNNKSKNKIKTKTKKIDKKRVKTKTNRVIKNTQSQSINPNKLFKSINLNKTNQNSKNGNSGKSTNKSNKNKGVENRYFAKVQQILKNWPAQSNFAGEKIRVQLIIYQSGLFDYKILYKSLNPEFNQALKNYLEQLKRIGFGLHSNPKPYKIIVEFIAK